MTKDKNVSKKNSSGLGMIITLMIFLGVIIMLELIMYSVVIAPCSKLNNIVECLEEGKFKQAKSYSDRVPESYRVELEDVLKTYVNNEIRAYRDEKEEYEDAQKHIDNVGDFKVIDNFVTEASDTLYSYKIQNDIAKIVEAIKNGETAKAETMAARFDENKSDELKKALEEAVDELMTSYMNDEFTAEEFSRYISCFKAIALISDKADEIETRYESIAAYRKEYEDANRLVEEKESLKALELYMSIECDPEDTVYIGKIKEAIEKCKTTAKQDTFTYVKQQLILGEGADAISVFGKLKELIKDDKDITDFETSTLSGWRVAYGQLSDKSFVGMPVNVTGAYLYDINGDDVPELLLNSGDNGGEVYICTYTDNMKNLGVIERAGNTIKAGIMADGSIVSVPAANDQAVKIFTISNGTLATAHSFKVTYTSSLVFQNIPDKFYVDDAEVDKSTYESKLTGCANCKLPFSQISWKSNGKIASKYIYGYGLSN